MKFALCDNDSSELFHIKKIIDEYNLTSNNPIQYRLFHSGEELLSAPDLSSFHAILLDIYMSDSLSGIECAQQMDPHMVQRIVFLTTSKEHAIDAFRLNALHYLIKPIQLEDLTEIITRLNALSSISVEQLIVETKKTTCSIPYTDIISVEVLNRICTVHTMQQDYSFYSSLADIEEKLNDPCFIKVNRSYLVNANYVSQFSSNSVILTNDTEVTISRKLKDTIKTRLADFMLQSR